MTLFKLSLRNAQRQARDYLVYFVTIIMSAALIFAFNGLVSSKEISNLSSLLSGLPLMIVAASVVVVCIIGWLVHYTMRFMLTKRSRELGTYILMGMENREVARLFLLENLLVGGIALVGGILFGNLLFQGLRAITLQMFGAPYTFNYSFSLLAVVLTIVYFIAIYLFSLLRSRKRIRKMKIYDLVYLDRQNEDETVKKSKLRKRIFSISIICGIVGTVMLMLQNLVCGLIGAALIIVFLYGFFISFSSGVPNYFNKRPAKKYAGGNLIVFRSLASKLTTMGVTMATIAVLFTATIIAEGTGLFFNMMFGRRAELYTSYDVFVGSDDPNDDLSAYRKYLNENANVQGEYEYTVYTLSGDEVTSYVESNVDNYARLYDADTVMAESDYVALRKMLGYTPAEIQPGKYIIHCMDYAESLMKNYDKPLEAGEQTLQPGHVYAEDFTQYSFQGNGSDFILVVPDEIAKQAKPAARIYGAMTDEAVIGDLYDGLEKIADTRYQKDKTFNHVLSPDKVREDNAVMYAMVVFPLFYIALVLTMVAATILTIQLLSEVNHYRGQYGLLHKLGMARKDMKSALGKQFALYYTMPAVPPILISVAFLLALGGSADAGVLFHPLSLWLGVIGVALAIFFAIYLLYIVTAYTSFRRNVLPD